MVEVKCPNPATPQPSALQGLALIPGTLGTLPAPCFSFLRRRRFRCIVHPFREKLTLRKALVTIAVIWALALLIMCPSAVTLTVTREEHHFMVDARNRSYPLYSCWEAWPEKGMRKVYTAVLFSHIYLAPLALIVVMYARIARKLCQAPGCESGGRNWGYEATGISWGHWKLQKSYINHLKSHSNQALWHGFEPGHLKLNFYPPCYTHHHIPLSDGFPIVTSDRHCQVFRFFSEKPKI